jgi:hypothetical protein
MRTFFFALLITITCCASAQDFLTYAAVNIPDSLQKNADAVYRLDETEIIIESGVKLTTKEHVIVTILTQNGLNHSRHQVNVSNNTKLDDITIKVFNSLGIEVAKYKKKDMELKGILSSTTFASDDKIYTIDFPVPDLPCTVEYVQTTTDNGFLDLPTFFMGGYHESFLNSRYIVKVNHNNSINYKAYNTKVQPTVQIDNVYKTYTWEQKNQPVFPYESGSAGSSNLPRIDISPLYFNYEGHSGSMKSWSEFGKWRLPFYTEEKPFTGEKVNFFNSLIQNAKSEKEKISILYKYVQSETRYLFIAYGIGGFKPFPSSFVEKNKYGDCKALSNYLKHILQAVGIKSYTASIYAGSNNILFDPSFVSNISNHIILCVPHQNDTTWLECTSKLTQPGILGNFTENRNALLLTENGGVLVNTPTSKAINNQWIAKTRSQISDDGGAIVRSRIYITGDFWQNFYYATNGKSKDEIKKALVNQFGYKAPDEYEMNIVGDSAAGHVITLDLAYYKFFDFKAGSKHFFPFRQYKLNEETIAPAETRRYEYLFDFPYIKTDSTVYQLPANFKQEALPPAKQIKHNFVEYQNNIQLNNTGSELTVTTHLTLNNHIVPAKLYNEVALVFDAIKKDEGQKIVLKKE